jgi:hypothetical protein
VKNKSFQAFIALALLALSTSNSQLATAHAQGTAFTYQGRLNDGAMTVSGNYDLTFAVFSVGMDDKHIATVDEGGVTLAAIQGLNQKVEELKTELNRRDSENADLKKELSEIKQLLSKLAGNHN